MMKMLEKMEIMQRMQAEGFEYFKGCYMHKEAVSGVDPLE